MNPLLLSGYGNSMTVDQRKLIVVNKTEKTRTEFFPHHMPHDLVIVDGHTGYVTFEAMRWLSKHNVTLALLNWDGNLLSVTTTNQLKSGKLRIRQYEKYLDYKSRLDIAEKSVSIKIEKTVELLENLSCSYESVDTKAIKEILKNELESFERVKKKAMYFDNKIDIKYSLKRLMNMEGKIASAYIEQLTRIFSKVAPEFNFQGRKNKSNKHNMNAANEINALYNYGYSILEAEIRKTINTTGLDPAVGFLHESIQSKSPLVYDVQELFRWLIDLSVIELLEEKKLKKKDFLVTESYNTRLRETAAKLLVEKIKNNFNRKITYKRNRKHSYQNILLDNVQMLANFVSGKTKKLEFLIPSIPTESDLDFKKIKQDLIQMSPERRKELGINKSTLWYLKKNIESGKKPKIYKKVLEKLDTSFA